MMLLCLVSIQKKRDLLRRSLVELEEVDWLPVLLLPYQGCAIVPLITHVKALANMPLLDLLFDGAEVRHDVKVVARVFIRKPRFAAFV